MYIRNKGLRQRRVFICVISDADISLLFLLLLSYFHNMMDDCLSRDKHGRFLRARKDDCACDLFLLQFVIGQTGNSNCNIWTVIQQVNLFANHCKLAIVVTCSNPQSSEKGDSNCKRFFSAVYDTIQENITGDQLSVSSPNSISFGFISSSNPWSPINTTS